MKQPNNEVNPVILHLQRIQVLIGAGVYTHVYQWLCNNRKTYPAFIFRAGVTAVAICFACLALTILHTATGRIVEDVILQAGLCIGLIMLLCVFAIASAAIGQAWKHGMEQAAEMQEEEAKLLPETTGWQEPYIGGDILICLRPNESEMSFSERLNEATLLRSWAKWIVAIPPFKTSVAIFKAPDSGVEMFPRGIEPFLPMLPDGDNASGLEYYDYIAWFAPRYTRWAEIEKIKANPERADKTLVEVIANAAKASANILLLLLCSLSAFAQSKARQVDDNLGTRIREIPGKGETVNYRFDERGKEVTYTRTGDGHSDYVTLLQHTKGLVQWNDEGGTLIDVQKNGQVVCRGPQVEQVNTNPNAREISVTNQEQAMRPRGIPGQQQPEPETSFLPDSSELARKLDGAQTEFDTGKAKLWAAVRPVWKFLMGIFSGLSAILICFGGLCRYIAKTAANESLISSYGRVLVGGWIVSAQQNSAAMVLVICWGFAVVLLINQFLWLVWFGLSGWWLVAAWMPTIWLAEWITNWIVPNPKVANGERGMSRM